MGTKKQSKKQTYSQRSEILLRVLDWINSGAYDDGGDYILFGRKSIYDLIDELTGDSEADSTEREAIPQIVSDLKIHRGRRLAAERVSLGKKPELTRLRGVDKLSPSTVQRLEDEISKQQRSEVRPAPPQRSYPIGDLDAKYAHEVIEKLEKIVERAR